MCLECSTSATICHCQTGMKPNGFLKDKHKDNESICINLLVRGGGGGDTIEPLRQTS